MISWMQHNKKYLIVTLWISAFAFIGAGFVGWGSYQYGSKNTSIAKVGEIEIKMSEFQITYSNLYSYYSQMFGGNFDKEMAKQMKLEDSAFQILKREALLLNVAKDFGLQALDEEIAENIFKNQSFFKDGNFSKEQYLLILKNSHLTPKDYEARLHKVILIAKIQSLLKVGSTPFEEEIINSITKLQDDIEYKILTTDDVQVSVNADEVKNLWETTKNNYMTEEKYKISYIETPLVEKNISETEIKDFYNLNALDYSDTFENSQLQIHEDILKKASKKDAIKEYIAFKKGSFSGEVFSDTIGQVSFLMSAETMTELQGLKVGDILKPRFYNGRFVTLKLDEIISPKVEKFEIVESVVEENLIAQKKETALTELAKKSYKSFSGIKTGLISVSDANKLTDLFPQEANELLNNIFTQSTDNGFVRIGSKVIIYKVLGQKINQENAQNFDNSIISNIKEKVLNDSLVKKLEYHYLIETYFKG